MPVKGRPAAHAEEQVGEKPASAQPEDWTLAMVGTGDLVEDEDAPCGVYDDRATSRAQRHVFEHNESRIDPGDWGRF
eukprot:6142572-Pyramimonas_sp.AAC.1